MGEGAKRVSEGEQGGWKDSQLVEAVQSGEGPIGVLYCA